MDVEDGEENQEEAGTDQDDGSGGGGADEDVASQGDEQEDKEPKDEMQAQAEVEEEESEDDTAGKETKGAKELLSTDSSDILSHLSRFPNLETLSIYFDFDIENWGESIHIFVNEERKREREEAEHSLPWRKLMLRIFESVARNGPVSIPKLELLNLPPAIVSFYKSKDLNDFLGGFRSFKLNLSGGENGAGWNMNTQPGWVQFASRLKAYFFDHLRAVEEVAIEGHETSPLGCEGGNSAPLPFGKQQMPQLRSLFLKNCFIDSGLVDLLTQQLSAGKLEELVLEDCHSTAESDMAQDHPTWAELFLALSTTKSQSLKKFEVREAGTYPNDNGINIMAYDEDDNVQEVREVKTILEDQEKNGRRLFSYISLDGKYGMVFPQEWLNREKFLAGGDQKAYDDLMTMVMKNVSRNGTTALMA